MSLDYLSFVKQIYEITQIDLNLYKEKQMHRRIDSLIAKYNITTYDEYLSQIRQKQDMLNEFLTHITINVSEFYRNPEQWKIFETEILQSLLNKTDFPKIWSAACSTGDEPYSLVMLLSKYIPLKNIKIVATDLDKIVLEKAKAGIYTSKSLEGVPPTYLQKHFNYNEKFYQIKDEIKNCVQFKTHNLLRDVYPSNLDLIICRNVLIYFTEEAKDSIYTKFNGALKTGGILFIGSTEQIIYSHKFGFNAVKTFFYEKDKHL